MEPPTKKKYQTLSSNLEVKLEETPPTLTLSSPNLKKKKLISPHSPNSSLLTSVNHLSNLDHWLVQWHRLHQQPPSPTAWWPKPWELEYPKEETPPAPKKSFRPFSPHNTIKEMEVEMILLNLTNAILENARKEGQEVPNPSCGGGGGGGGPNPAGSRDVTNPEPLSDKMIGKEPEIFTRDQDKVEEFMTSWSIYHGINKQTRVMNNPMSQTMLFFGYLRGPNIHLWIKKISTQLDRHLHTGGRETDEWIWDTMINNFAQNFQDVMS